MRFRYAQPLSLFLVLVAVLLVACQNQPAPIQVDKSSSEFASSWPMEGYSPQRARNVAETLPIPLNQQQEYALADSAEHASPVTIADGLLYVEGDQRLHALALTDGVERWQYPLAGSFFSPAVISNTVYVRSEQGSEGYLYALRADTGIKRWAYKFAQVGSSFNNVGGHVTSPVIVDDLLFVGAAQQLYALDAQTGTLVWSFATEYPIVTSVTVADDLIYFADFARAYAVARKTGQERWRFDHDKLALYFAPIVIDQQVAIAGADTIYMLDRNTGKQLWSKSFDQAQVIPAGASPQQLYVKTTNQLWALDRVSGQILWNYATLNFVSLPAITQDQLYVITRVGDGGQVHALQQANGQESWHSDQTDLANAAPVITGGRLYVRKINGSVLVFRSSS